MYDVIMDLPLFQGISREHVSQFLEKTYVEVINFEAGTVLMHAGDTEDALLYVIGGVLELEWKNQPGDIKILFTLGERSLVDASHLYGMARAMPYTLRARTDVSLLRIEKTQFMAFLDKQPIYLLNFVNYLSLRAQKGMSALAHVKDASLRTLLSVWINETTPSEADNIEIHASISTLSRYCNMSVEGVRRALAALQARELITRKRDVVSVLSRRQFLQELFS